MLLLCGKHATDPFLDSKPNTYDPTHLLCRSMSYGHVMFALSSPDAEAYCIHLQCGCWSVCIHQQSAADGALQSVQLAGLGLGGLNM